MTDPTETGARDGDSWRWHNLCTYVTENTGMSTTDLARIIVHAGVLQRSGFSAARMMLSRTGDLLPDAEKAYNMYVDELRSRGVINRSDER